MLSNYRNSQNKSEITKLFTDDSNAQSFIWQNINSRRFKHAISNLSVNTVLQTIHINLDEDFEFIHPESVFYIKLTENDTVCKCRYLAHGKSDITLYMPKKIKTIELRTENRFLFDRTSSVKATVVVSSDVVASVATEALSLRVLDISRSGISFYVDNKNIQKLIASDTFILSHLNSVALNPALIIENKYSHSFSFRSGGKSKYAFKLGFKLTESLSQLVIDNVVLSIPG
jgi:hypothetical protein